MSEAELFSETRVVWLDVERRLGECARCPADPRELPPCGEHPEWVLPGYLARPRIESGEYRAGTEPCPKWKEYELTRRLEEAGLDRLLSRVRTTSLQRLDNAATALKEFIARSGPEAKHPRGFQMLVEGPLARQYAAAILRECVRYYKHSHFAVLHAPTQIREWKNSLSEKEAVVLADFIEPHVLYIDAADGDGCLEDKWFRKQLSHIYDRRRSSELPTIISARSPVKEVFPEARVLRVK